jgi:hypothetical protein
MQRRFRSCFWSAWQGPGEQKKNAWSMRCPTTAYIYIITEVNPYWISTYRFLWVCMLFLCCLYVSYRFRSIQAASFRQKSPSSPPWASSLTESSDEMLRHKQKLPFQHIPNLANLRLIYANHNLIWLNLSRTIERGAETLRNTHQENWIKAQ